MTSSSSSPERARAEHSSSGFLLRGRERTGRFFGSVAQMPANSHSMQSCHIQSYNQPAMGADVLITRMSRLLSMCLTALFVVTFFGPSAAHAQDILQRQARLPWWERAEEKKIGHYWIKTDVEPELANSLARHLNLMYEQYAQRLASLPSREPEKLNVMIFAEHLEYQFVLRTKFGVDGTGSGGMFFANPSGTALAFWIENLPRRRIEHVLQHEGFHQFAFSRFGAELPPWANEGLAEFFGEAVLVNRKLVIGQTTPRVIKRIRDAIELNEHIPLRRMLTMDGQLWGAQVRRGDAALQYHQAWSMVQFLVYGDGGRYVQAFENYLKMINAGYTSEQSFIRAFGSPDIEAFEKQWKEFVLQMQPSAFVTAMERMEFLAAGALHLREQKIVPETLEELKAKLRAVGFTYTLGAHGVETVLNADDDSLFVIFEDDLSDQQPVFAVGAIDLRRATFRERKLAEQHPFPCGIQTQHLQPHEISVRWVRDEDEPDAFTFRIEVK